MADKLKVFLPSADDATRQQLQLVLETIMHYAVHANEQFKQFSNLSSRPEFRQKTEAKMIGEATAKVRVAETSLNFKMLALQKTVANLGEFEKEITYKIDLFEARILRFRRELEVFFRG